ncbi:hypothetical protein [Otoolea muris]
MTESIFQARSDTPARKSRYQNFVT